MVMSFENEPTKDQMFDDSRCRPPFPTNLFQNFAPQR